MKNSNDSLLPYIFVLMASLACVAYAMYLGAR